MRVRGQNFTLRMLHTLQQKLLKQKFEILHTPYGLTLYILRDAYHITAHLLALYPQQRAYLSL